MFKNGPGRKKETSGQPDIRLRETDGAHNQSENDKTCSWISPAVRKPVWFLQGKIMSSHSARIVWSPHNWKAIQLVDRGVPKDIIHLNSQKAFGKSAHPTPRFISKPRMSSLIAWQLGKKQVTEGGNKWPVLSMEKLAVGCPKDPYWDKCFSNSS